MKKDGKQKGFTLLELLIACSIFAASAVLVVGSFGISTKNQRQVKVNRDISQSIRYISQEIARQIEFSLNKPLVNNIGQTIMQDSNPVYNFAVTNGPGEKKAVDGSAGDTLFVRGADDQCRYYRLDANHQLVVYINEDCKEAVYKGPYFLSGETTTISKLQFKGIMNRKDKDEQASVWIILESISGDSEFKIPMKTKTMAIIRNYGNEE